MSDPKTQMTPEEGKQVAGGKGKHKPVKRGCGKGCRCGHKKEEKK